ncbi:MAG: hypothetical protein JSR87_08525 [Proteobacteria bacterium]|nr:hypothetical protein [Pseudomonadota bacterium]MBS0572564.1 hypothetical protein [Pseudomonadota bacterium]
MLIDDYIPFWLALRGYHRQPPDVRTRILDQYFSALIDDLPQGKARQRLLAYKLRQQSA